MKRWEYSKSWKTLAVVLNQICAVVLVLSVIVCTMYVGSNGFGWISRDQGFESTAYYQNEVLEQIYRCIRAASRESKFEKNGVYDGSLLVNVEEYAENNKILTLHEPACGSGGMIMAAVDVLYNKYKFNYSHNLLVECGDIDARCVHMTYLQLSLAGVSAVVYQRDTLSMQTWQRWETPTYIMQYLRFRNVLGGDGHGSADRGLG